MPNESGATVAASVGVGVTVGASVAVGACVSVGVTGRSGVGVGAGISVGIDAPISIPDGVVSVSAASVRLPRSSSVYRKLDRVSSPAAFKMCCKRPAVSAVVVSHLDMTGQICTASVG